MAQKNDTRLVANLPFQCVMLAPELADVCVLCNFFFEGKAAIFTL